jgi:hypothetical protein
MAATKAPTSEEFHGWTTSFAFRSALRAFSGMCISLATLTVSFFQPHAEA